MRWTIAVLFLVEFCQVFFCTLVCHAALYHEHLTSIAEVTHQDVLDPLLYPCPHDLPELFDLSRFCQSAKLLQFILQLVRPSANLSSAGRDMEHPEVSHQHATAACVHS